MSVQPATFTIPSGHYRKVQRHDRIGIVLFHWGGPSSVRNVHSFLRRVYDERYIKNFFWGIRNIQAVLSWGVAVSMRQKIQYELSAVGGNCPAIKLINEQARALQSTLTRRWGNKVDVHFRVYTAMRYAHPFAYETAQQMYRDGIEHVVLVPAYLQESNVGRQKSVDNWHELSTSGDIPQWPTCELPSFVRTPRVITALNERIDQTLQRFPKSLRSDAAIIFCAPELPDQDKDKFHNEVSQVGKVVMQQRAEKRPIYTAFYVYYGAIGDHLRGLKKKIVQVADEGNRCVMLLPLCGTTENLQTTYSMDISCREYAHQAGIHHFQVAKTLNSNSLFLETLSDLIGSAVRSSMSNKAPSVPES